MGRRATGPSPHQTVPVTAPRPAQTTRHSRPAHRTAHTCNHPGGWHNGADRSGNQPRPQASPRPDRRRPPAHTLNRTNPTHQPHTHRTWRAAIVRPSVAPRCLACLRRPPAGVCLRRSRPLSHPKGDPETVVGNGSGEPAGRRGGNHRGTHPQAPGFPKGFPRTPILCPSRPTRRARYAGTSAAAQAARTAGEERQPVPGIRWQTGSLWIMRSRVAAPLMAAGSVRGRRPAVAPPRGSRRRPRR
jgi:hypothetical protein